MTASTGRYDDCLCRWRICGRDPLLTEDAGRLGLRRRATHLPDASAGLGDARTTDRVEAAMNSASGRATLADGGRAARDLERRIAAMFDELGERIRPE